VFKTKVKVYNLTSKGVNEYLPVELWREVLKETPINKLWRQGRVARALALDGGVSGGVAWPRSTLSFAHQLRIS
jgi:hypothetical protein